MLSPDRILACWEESQVTDTDFLWQVQYFRCLREVPRDPTYPRSFCVAGAIFSMPPRSSCVTRTQGSLVTPPLFFCGRCQLFRCLREVPRDTAKGCLWPYLLVNNFAASWPYLPLGKSHKWLTFVTLKPFPHPSPHPKTPVPPSYTLKGGCTYKAICLSTMWFCHFETLPPPQSPP